MNNDLIDSRDDRVNDAMREAWAEYEPPKSFMDYNAHTAAGMIRHAFYSGWLAMQEEVVEPTEARIDLAERAIDEWFATHDGEEIDCRALARIAVMQGKVGGLPDEVERDLTELYCRLNEGVFYSDYDEDGRLMGVLRKHLAALAASPPVDQREACWLVECPKYYPGEYFALCDCGCGRHHWTADVHKATKFTTKEEAETTRGGDTNCIAVEHLFGLTLPRPARPVDQGRIERLVRELAEKLYHHTVTKYDPAAAERCIQQTVAALTNKGANP